MHDNYFMNVWDSPIVLLYFYEKGLDPHVWLTKGSWRKKTKNLSPFYYFCQKEGRLPKKRGDYQKSFSFAHLTFKEYNFWAPQKTNINLFFLEEGGGCEK